MVCANNEKIRCNIVVYSIKSSPFSLNVNVTDPFFQVCIMEVQNTNGLLYDGENVDCPGRVYKRKNQQR